MKRFAFLLTCLCLISCVSQAQSFDYSFRENYKVSSPTNLTISSHDGNIEVLPGEGNEVRVFYIVKRNGKILNINRTELEKELILEVAHNGSRLEIRVKDKMNQWIKGFTDRMNVHFKIYTPVNTAAGLYTSDGNISVHGLTSNQNCKTSDGNILISDIRGNVTAKTSDGNIHVKEVLGSSEAVTSDGNITIESVTGDLYSSTSDGNIKLSKVKGAMSLKTSDGDIIFQDVSGSLKASTSDGNIRGTMIELRNELTIRTSDGNINVSVPNDLGLDLDIKGGSLNVPFKNFSGKSDKKYIQGKSNGGGIPVNLYTSDGNVTLIYL